MPNPKSFQQTKPKNSFLNQEVPADVENLLAKSDLHSHQRLDNFFDNIFNIEEYLHAPLSATKAAPAEVSIDRAAAISADFLSYDDALGMMAGLQGTDPKSDFNPLEDGQHIDDVLVPTNQNILNSAGSNFDSSNAIKSGTGAAEDVSSAIDLEPRSEPWGDALTDWYNNLATPSV